VFNLLIFLINFNLFLFGSSSFSEEKPLNKKLGGFEIRVLKRKDEHIKTAAIICSLIENNSSIKLIEEGWGTQLEKPVSSDDEYLVKFIMRDMCPKESESYFKDF
tara:strand:+ start:108 stop:422 length:315 start_codon:yes stop_codon:yes gene_type:complete